MGRGDGGRLSGSGPARGTPARGEPRTQGAEGRGRAPLDSGAGIPLHGGWDPSTVNAGPDATPGAGWHLPLERGQRAPVPPRGGRGAPWARPPPSGLHPGSLPSDKLESVTQLPVCQLVSVRSRESGDPSPGPHCWADGQKGHSTPRTGPGAHRGYRPVPTPPAPMAPRDSRSASCGQWLAALEVQPLGNGTPRGPSDHK